jgi:predicted O-methyltransferase YrrM
VAYTSTITLPTGLAKEGLRKGRSPLDGYKRGWGIQFGGLDKIIGNDPLYKKCLKEMRVQTWVSEPKRQNLFLLMTQFLPQLQDTNIVEFGTYKGGNAVFMALVMREVCPDAMIYALDTFSGMPATDKSVDAHNEKDFYDADFDGLLEEIERLELRNLVPVKGLFEDTFPNLVVEKRFGLAHIDADIYSAIKYAQSAVWPRMTAGGYVVYDDAEVSSCIGATEAVEEMIMDRRIHSEQIWPHFVFRAGLD